MGFEPGFVLGDGFKHSGNAMADVVFDNVADVESGDEDADDGIDDVEPVCADGAEVSGQGMGDKVD